MKHTFRRILTAATAVVLTVGLVTPATVDAAPSYPTPILDPFFHIPAKDYEGKPHGKLLRHRVLASPFVPGGTATQMVFTTRNTHNHHIYATATLVKPRNFPPNGKVVVFNDFINSLGVGCQPSFSYSTINPEWNSRSLIAQWYGTIAAHYGYALLIPDHEGMNAAYTANVLAGHIVLDAVRAMKNTPTFQMRKSWTGMLGYSGGAMVSLWAANMRKDYAPDVHFKAIAVGGIPTDLQYYGASLGNRPSPAFGLAFASLIGLEREYPRSMDVTSRLSARGKSKILTVKDACAQRIIRTMDGESAATIFKGVEFNTHTEKTAFRILRQNSLLYDRRNPDRGTNIYIFGSRHDPAAPVKKVRALARRYCKAGARIQYSEVSEPDHIKTAFENLPGAAQWLFKMSNGGKIRNDCRRIPK